MNLRTSKQKGFTIVELLIVIVVIAILAAISIVAFTGVQQRARDTQRAANAKTVSDAISAYNADKGEWPTNANLVTELTAFTTVKVPTDVLGNVEAVTTAPTDATAQANAAKVQVVTAANGATVYYVQENGNWAWKNYKVGL